MGCTNSKERGSHEIQVEVVSSHTRKYQGKKSAHGGQLAKIRIHGTESHSSWIVLNEGGKQPTIVDPKAAGVAGAIWKVDLDQKVDSPPWFVEKILIIQNDQTLVFPCYQWIVDAVHLRLNAAVLPQNDIAKAQQARKDALEAQRGIYQWERTDGLPAVFNGTFDNLPHSEIWTDGKAHDFQDAAMEVKKDFMLDLVAGVFRVWDDFDDFEDLFHTIDLPKIHTKSWKSDVEYGRQKIQGAPLSQIKKLDAVPTNFPVSTEMLKKFLRPDTTLESEIEAGRVFIIDYAIVDGLTCHAPKEKLKQRYQAAPLVLMYVNGDDHLVPIAIQLRQIPNSENPIFTPQDSEADWMMAKIFANNAEFAVHQIAEHFLKTHLATEPIIVAMHRNLSNIHPIFKIMHPHFRFQLAINCLARNRLLMEGGLLPENSSLTYPSMVEVLKRTYSTWKFEGQCLPKMLENRGLLDSHGKSRIPNYHYCEDSIKLWNAILKWVTAIVENFYKNDQDVVGDWEIQNFAAEICETGYGQTDHGFPSSFSTRLQLAEVVTTVIFTASVQHAALNFQQYDSFAFVPFTPASLFMEPMKKKGVITMKDVFNALPPKNVSANQIAVLFVLSSYSGDEQFLGQYVDNFFVEEEILKSWESFKSDLASISKEITARGEYLHLMPNKIPNSTAI